MSLAPVVEFACEEAGFLKSPFETELDDVNVVITQGERERTSVADAEILDVSTDVACHNRTRCHAFEQWLVIVGATIPLVIFIAIEVDVQLQLEFRAAVNRVVVEPPHVVAAFDEVFGHFVPVGVGATESDFGDRRGQRFGSGRHADGRNGHQQQ